MKFDDIGHNCKICDPPAEWVTHQTFANNIEYQRFNQGRNRWRAVNVKTGRVYTDHCDNTSELNIFMEGFWAGVDAADEAVNSIYAEA